MDRRSEIVMTAGDLFRKHGYHATSMRDIAKTLNLRGSSLYAHIASKEEVLWEIVSAAADTFLAHAGSVDTSLSPRERLEHLVRGHLRVIIQELPNATVFFHEWKFLSPELKAQVIARRDAYEKHFREAIQAGVETGVFQVEDVKIAALFVLSALNWSYQWMNVAGPLSVDDLADHYVRLIFSALCARQA